MFRLENRSIPMTESKCKDIILSILHINIKNSNFKDRVIVNALLFCHSRHERVKVRKNTRILCIDLDKILYNFRHSYRIKAWAFLLYTHAIANSIFGR